MKTIIGAVIVMASLSSGDVTPGEAEQLATGLAIAEIYRDQCGPWGPGMSETYRRYQSGSNLAARDHVRRSKVNYLLSHIITREWCNHFSGGVR
jgi:hypothetical protein